MLEQRWLFRHDLQHSLCHDDKPFKVKHKWKIYILDKTKFFWCLWKWKNESDHPCTEIPSFCSTLLKNICSYELYKIALKGCDENLIYIVISV